MDFGSPLLRAWSSIRTPPVHALQEDDNTQVGPECDFGVQAELDTTQPLGTTLSARKRTLQCVSSKAQRVRVLKWMLETVETSPADKFIVSAAVAQFPDVFRSMHKHSNLQKCARWWKERETMLEEFEKDHLSLSHTYLGSRKHVELKARPGRGRKTADWCNWLYLVLRTGFDRLRKTGVKFSPQVLLVHALHPSFCLMFSPIGSPLEAKTQTRSHHFQINCSQISIPCNLIRSW